MYVPLSPCPSCQRHVRADVTACPFCASAIDPSSLVVTPDVGGMRLGRAAVFAFAATVSSVACRSTQTDQVAPSTVTVSDTSAPSVAAPSVAPSMGPDDHGAVVALYGVPMPQPEQVAPDAAAPPLDAATAPDVVVVADAGRRPARPSHPTPSARPTAPVVPSHGPVMVRAGTPPADEDLV